MSEHVALYVVGLVLLAVSAGCLVIGAARLDRALGRSAFAIGLVAVGFGPCVASLAFNLTAALHERPLLALRTIIGFNIASAGLVLGVAALVRPLAGTARLSSSAITLLLVATLLFWFLCRDSELSRLDAGVLLAAFVAAVVYLVFVAKREPETVKAAFAAWVPERMSVWFAVLLSLAALGGVIGGAILAVAASIPINAIQRVYTPILGLSAAAFAVSLPGLVAAVAASRRGRSGVVLGIVVGGVLFHLLVTAGVMGMVHPIVVQG